MKQVLSREAKDFCWVAFPLLLLFLVDCSIVPRLLNSFGLTCKRFFGMFAFFWCSLGVCSPVPRQEWFVEDVFGCSLAMKMGISSAYNGALQGSHPEAQGLYPLV